MSCEALFRADSYLKSVEATVTSVGPQGIECDRTVFYPLGGGQAADSGRAILPDGEILVIGDARKARRELATPDDVLHIPAPGQDGLVALIVPGMKIRLEIDWERRYRHMRFHTATHVLCAIVKELVDGCSINAQTARLDFATDLQLDRAEIESQLATVVAAAQPLSMRWISDEELLANPQLVKSMSVSPPMGFGRVRLIEIEGVDLQPCGGTHVANSAEIGAVQVTKIEKKGARSRRINLAFAGDGATPPA